jgi:hypothetical protein
MIIAGISALASAGGATATAVLEAKENAENERHHRQLEALVPGASGAASEATGDKPTQTGTSLSPIGLASTGPDSTNTSDEELVGRAIAFLTRKGFTVSLR